jgi:hypothetical protein
VQQGAVGLCTPAVTTDLADEHEHDERAGLDQDHHDEALHDVHSSSSI